MSFANNTIIIELLSPQDILSGRQYTYEGSRYGDALMRSDVMRCFDVSKKEEKMEEVTDDENSNLEVEECPICMDAIDTDRNCVTTECGHKFHAKCLFANIARNGFDCPCCRGKMAEEVEEDEDEEYEEDEEEDFDEDEEEDNADHLLMLRRMRWMFEDNTDHLLRGMRWMFQRASNDGGVVDEDEEEDDEDQELVALPTSVDLPSVDVIMEKLTGRGITFEHVIKSLLNDCHPEYTGNFKAEAGNLFGAVRSILANYVRENGQRSEEEEGV